MFSLFFFLYLYFSLLFFFFFCFLLFFRINVVSHEAFSGSGFGEDGITKARVWLFVSFILSFAGLLGSGWILFAKYVVPDRSEHLPSDKWPGVALFLQNILIFIRLIFLFLQTKQTKQTITITKSAIILRFGRGATS